MHDPRSRLRSSSMLARYGLAMLLFAVMIFSLTTTSFAAGGQFGNLNGTVVDSHTKAPIAGATVVAIAGSGTYSAVTNARGFFSILGMNADTYSVSISAVNYERQSITGVVVFGDQTTALDTVGLLKHLKTIARVKSVSRTSAFQPSQTIDSYTVSGAAVTQTTGKAFATNENALVLAVPGVTLTNNGVPTIRGGAAYELGYQFDGVTFKEPFLGNNGSNGMFNGLGSVQVVEGAGDATQGGVGSGVINIIPQQGEGPGAGSLDLESGGPNFSHQLGFHYGFSTPNRRFSDYFAYTGQRFNPYLGYHSTPLAEYGNYFATTYEATDQLLNNFFFHFGKNNHETFQILYANISQREYGQAGPGGTYNPVTNPNALVYYPYDQLTQAIPTFLAGYTPAQYASLIGLGPGVPSYNAAITSPQQNFANQTRFLKFEYDNSLNETTYLDVRYFNWAEDQFSDNQYSGGFYGTQPGFISAWTDTGGPTVGMSADLEKQIGSKLTATLNVSYNVLYPKFNAYEPQLTVLAGSVLAFPSNPFLTTDWLPGGYLQSYFPNGVPRLPSWGIGYNGTNFQNWGTGLRLQYSPTNRLYLDLGIRDEGQNQHWFSQVGQLGLGAPPVGYNVIGCAAYAANAANFAQCPSSPVNNPFDVTASSWTNQVLHPKELQPRASISYKIDARDSIRFGYGRSAVFANAQTAGTPFHLYGLQPYLRVPAKPGAICGNPATLVFGCTSYAQQLYWQGDAVEAPDAGNGTPALYTNVDMSYQHLFKNGWGLRVTPFVKRGTNLPTFFVLNPTLGIFAVSNQGLNKTAGLELGLTTPQRALGISGFLSATYQNVLSTTPPFSANETTVPFIPTASLALGDLYRAGYVSPFSVRIGGTDNLKHGWSVSPQLQFDIGYPYSVGNMIAAQIGTSASGQPIYANIPQVDFGPGITGGQSSFVGGNPGASVATNYYDPAFPGSALDPNIAATRGTPGTAVNGGKLSHPNLYGDLTIQYTSHGNTFGVQMLNLFGNAFNGSVPAINTYYQPVANGLSGPQTGVNVCTAQVGTARGCTPYIPNNINAFSNGAYLLSNGNFTGTPGFAPLQPFTVQFFFQHRI